MKATIDDTGATAVHERTEDKSASGKPDADKQEMLKKMETAGKPGPSHKALETFVGNWKAEVKCWMEPGAEPKISHGTAKTKWILNGHFLEEEFHGEMMGKPFTGRWVIGFDNTKQKFTSVWVDDSGTSMTTSEGKGEDDNKIITLEGKTVCPGTGRTDLPMKQVFRAVDANKRVC